MSDWRRLAFGLLVGATAGLGHAPFYLWPIAVVAFGVSAYLVKTSPRKALTGWAIGLGYFGVTLHWIVQPFLVDVAKHGWMAPFALFFMAGGLALFWAMAGWMSARMRGYPALNWAVALALAEFARGHVFTGFPWALPAYIWSETPVRILAAYIGPYGLTALTLLIVAVPATKPKPIGFAISFAAASLLYVVSGSLFQSGHVSATGEENLVRLVQPNAPQHEKWDPQKAHIFVDRQIEFTAAPKNGVSLIVWPESALPYWYRRAEPAFERMSEAAEGVPVIFGINRAVGREARNAMAVLGKSGAIDDVYDKVHLVPFGEYIPFGGMARFVGLQSFAARDGYGFSSGETVRLIETNLGTALPLICYEAIFPGHLRKPEDRPDYILQITNDAWFGTFSGPFQHLQQARFRAVEQGLPLVRVANTGVSAMIDANGNITAELGLGQAGFLDAPLPPAKAATLYSKTGDKPILVFLLCATFALFAANLINPIAKRSTSS